MTAAKSIADRGAKAVLVERSESLGGMARELTCKGLVECRNCGACFAVDRADEVLRSPLVEVLLLSEVASVGRTDEGYVAKVKVAPRYVTDDCIGCSKCADVCPVDGKAIHPPKGTGLPRTHWIDRKRCLHFKKAGCTKCAEVCPTKAVDFGDRARNVTRKASSVVYATGMDPVDACEVARLGCGTLNDVMSSVDAERMLNEAGRLTRPSDGAAPKAIAVIQCVGSRSVKDGTDYCSKFCCKYSTKISQLIIDADPETRLDFYFMDLRTLHEPQDEFKTWAKDRKKTVRLIRSMPAAVLQGKGGKLVVRASTETDTEVQENEYDLVLLSVGMRPHGAATPLAGSLGIATDERGFAKASVELASKGVHVVGAVSEPMDIEETAVRTVSALTKVKFTKEGAR